MLEQYYTDFRDTHGSRPLALEAYEDSTKARTACGTSTAAGSTSSPPWVAMLGDDAFPGSLHLDRLTERFAGLARRYASIRQGLRKVLDDATGLRRLIISNPIAAWTRGAGTGGVSYSAFDGQALATSFSLPPQLRETGQDMVRELVDWRLTEYLRRTANGRGADTFIAPREPGEWPAHRGPAPARHRPRHPEGSVDLVADDQEYQANFVKVAAQRRRPAGV